MGTWDDVWAARQGACWPSQHGRGIEQQVKQTGDAQPYPYLLAGQVPLIQEEHIKGFAARAAPMFIALLDGSRVEAGAADRGRDYRCPNPDCGAELILKRGLLKVPHFAHKARTDCPWRGETELHARAKLALARTWRARGYLTDVEVVVPGSPAIGGDRRTDALVVGPNGRRYAFEVQRSSITLAELQARALFYAKSGIAQLWLPFLEEGKLDEAKVLEHPRYLPRYRVTSFLSWLNGFVDGERRGVWAFDPRDLRLWRARMSDIVVEDFSIYAVDFERKLKAHKDLTLEGPFGLEEVGIRARSRISESDGPYRWPAGRYIELIAGYVERSY